MFTKACILKKIRSDEAGATGHCPRGISKYTQIREHVDGVYPLNTSPTPVEKESVALMPLVEGPGSISDTASPLPTCRQGQRSVSVGTITRFDSPNNDFIQSGITKNTCDYVKQNDELTSVMPRPRVHNLMMRMMHESEPCDTDGGKSQSQRQQQTSTLSRIHSDTDPFDNYSCMGKFPPKYVRRQLWTVQTGGTSSSASSSSSVGNPCIPYNKGSSNAASGVRGTRNPVSGHGNVASSNTAGNPQTLAVRIEVGQARSMILMVLEELVNTESSYLHILSQFLVLRDEIFAPNWRIDRQKFIRLFPAAVDDLCNLHRESFDAMKLAFERTTKGVRHSEDTWSEDLLLSPYFQPHQYPRCKQGIFSGGDNEVTDDIGCFYTTPFSVLLEMIEGKRPLSCYSHSRSASSTATAAATLYYRSAPLWSTAPFFKLYARYLSEFSGAIQMLNKMRAGPTSLRKHLKQLQSHPACEFNDITTYLLAPVQRLPRYLLLVRKMIQYTEKIERLQNIPPIIRPRPRVGLRRSATPAQAIASTPGFPRLESLKRAEEALHGMLLELDEMIGGDVIDLKVETRDTTSGGGEEEYDFGTGGGSGGSSGFNKANSVYSNNCSDSVDVNSTTTAFDLVSTGDGADIKHRRAQSVVNPSRRKMRSSSAGFGGCGGGGGGGGFWSRLRRLRLTFTSIQQKKTAAKANANRAEVCGSENIVPPKFTSDSGAEILRKHFRKVNRKDPPTRRTPQAPRTKEAIMPMPSTFLHGGGRSSTQSAKSGMPGGRHTNKSDYRRSAGNTPIGTIMSTVKLSIAKSDSDSGVHTQTEEEQRRRRHQSSRQVPLCREQPVFSTGRSRWVGRPGHTPFATTISTQQSHHMRQQGVLGHQSSTKVRRSSDNGYRREVEDKDGNASRSVSPTISSTSSITSSASSTTAAESASALAPTASTSYSLSNVDSHLQPTRPVVGVISEAMKKIGAFTPPPSPPSVTLEAMVQEENRTKVEVQMSQENSESSDGVEVEDDDETAVADLDETPNALDDARAVEVDLCGHNTQHSKSDHEDIAFDACTSFGSTIANVAIVSAPANSPLDSLIDLDADHIVEGSTLCAPEVVPLVGRLCLEDFKE
ncbi:unnamed protein product [Hydatigera taeniaeformis]|uniref:DH domain-containing protein n=1 Tax=Hydatigena taeniaeformis TaxID=6205 RepID=A0A0R3X087_HYDTA|nr:unnamed protein product [Hydatigera taeniaeformis]